MNEKGITIISFEIHRARASFDMFKQLVFSSWSVRNYRQALDIARENTTTTTTTTTTTNNNNNNNNKPRQENSPGRN